MATKRKRVYNVLVKYEGDGDLIVEMAVAGYNMAEVFRFIADESEFAQKDMSYPLEIYITPFGDTKQDNGNGNGGGWDNQIFTEKIDKEDEDWGKSYYEEYVNAVQYTSSM